MPKHIVFAQYTNPQAYPPLEHSSGILSSMGWDVLFLGVEGPGESGNLLFPPRDRVEVKLLKYQPQGLQQKLHYLRFVLWVSGTTVCLRPQALYCSELWSTPAGLVCALLGVPVIYHEHDPPSQPQSWFVRQLHRCRRALVSRAALCVIPNEQRRRSFDSELHPRHSVTVWNCASRYTTVANASADPERFVLWYHGTLVPEQLPLCIIDALHLLPPHVELRFAGYETSSYPSYATTLRERAVELGLQDRVKYLGVLPSRTEIFREASRADLGLALFAKPFRAPMVGASNKPWEYLACGLPLLVCDDVDWRDWVSREQVGGVADAADPSAIAAAIDRMMQLPERGRAMGLRGRLQIAEGSWSYETQFAPVARFLEQLAQSSLGENPIAEGDKG